MIWTLTKEAKDILQKYSWFQTKIIILIKKGTKKHTWFQTTSCFAAVFIFNRVSWLLSCLITRLHISRLTLTWQSLDVTVHRKWECRWESWPRRQWEIRHLGSKPPITDSLANLRGGMLEAESEGETESRTWAAAHVPWMRFPNKVKKCIVHGLCWWLRQWGICLQSGRPGFSSWVRKIPWRRKEQLQSSCL